MKSLEQNKKYIQEFKDAFSQGVNSIVKAAEIYVKAITENPDAKQEFVDSCSDFIPASAWSGFEAVGKKMLHPKLLMGGGGKYAGKIKRLAYSDQDAVFTGKRFDLLTADGAILKVDVREVQEDQADQLFNGNHIRSVSEQKAYLESQKRIASTPQEKPEVMPYTITDGKVVFRRGVALNKSELRRILAEM